MSKRTRSAPAACQLRASSRCAVVSLAVSLLSAGSAWASEPISHPGPAEGANANLDLARGRAIQGREAFNAGDYETALALFRSAYTVYPAPTVVLYEARTLEKMGLLLEAAEAYVRTTQLSIPSGAPEQFAEAIAAARQEERALRPRIPTLTLRVDGVSGTDPNLKVSINGHAIGAAQLGQAQRLNPGTYRITGSLGSDRSDTAEVVLSESQKAAVVLDLTAPSLSPPAPVIRAISAEPSDGPATSGSSLRTAAIISGGIGLAGLGAGVVTGLMSVSKHDEADAACEDRICPTEGDGPDLVEDFRSLRTLSTVFYGVGAAGVAAGVVFWLLAPSDPDPSQAAIAPWFSGKTLGVQGAF